MVKEEEEKQSLLVDVEPASAGEPMSVDVKPEPGLKEELGDNNSLEFNNDAGTQDVDVKPNDRSKSSLSNSPPLPSTGPSSNKSSASPAPAPSASRKSQKPQPQLIGDLPISREEALKTFNEIQANNYQNKSLGRSKEMFESMTCDCVYDGSGPIDNACGPYSDCINRLTQVECLPDDCRCGPSCQNQRFQKRQYANIEIVLTELKGYGLRAESTIPKDSFIYEYVGDVVSPPTFKKRMREYALEGIQHFYFMMLQKDEFIDATKSGGIGRFANHSCNPNCYVAKWTVGDHVRMGIFAKRDIQKHEELTFNYNVDRYGHQAQTCYCGEPNCVGFIGGKTQTDLVTMDDLYLDALGITDEEEVAALKGTKKKKGKKLDDLDFMPKIKPVDEAEVPKVIQAIRQTQSKKVLLRILNRIKITEDQAALRQMMRLRGYSVMKIILDEHAEEFELVEMVLQCLKTWPLLNRNKVDDSVIDGSVTKLIDLHADESFKTLCRELLDHWHSLPVYTRIPKRVFQEGEVQSSVLDQSFQIHDYAKERQLEAEKRQQKQLAMQQRLLHERERQAKRQRTESAPHFPQFQPRPPQPPPLSVVTVPPVDSSLAHKQSVKEIIAAVEAKAEAERQAAAAAAEAEAKAAQEKAERIAKRKAKLAAKKTMTEEEKAQNKEKRLLKLIGAVVVKCMSKYAKGLSRDHFKKYAKELTTIIAEKEKRSPSYQEGKLDALSDEKQAKIKKFSKDYIAKVLRKLEKSGHSSSHSSSRKHDSHNGHRNGTNSHTNGTASSSTHTHTPSSVDGNGSGMGADTSMMSVDGAEMSMSVNEAMGFDPDSGSEDEHDEDAEGECRAADEATTGISPSMNGMSTTASLPSPPEAPGVSMPSIAEQCGRQGGDMSWESADPRQWNMTGGVHG